MLITDDIRVATVNGGPLSGMRNRLRNSRFRIATRGTSIAAAHGYSLDGWAIDPTTTTAAVTVSQNTDVPSAYNIPFSLRLTVTAADASISASDLFQFYQKIEGYEVQDLIGNTFMLGFWVRSPKTGVHTVSFINSSATRSYVATYTVNTANTWEWKTITVTGGIDSSGGGWNFTNGVGLYVIWALTPASTYITATTGSWINGNFQNTAAQPNCIDTVGNIFAIAGPRLERCTDMQPGYEEFEPIYADVLRNQRYLPSYIGSGGDDVGVGITTGTASGIISVPNLVTPRARPTGLIAVNPGSFTASNALTASACNGIAYRSSGYQSSSLSFTVPAATWSGSGVTVFFVNTNANGQLIWTGAEL